MYFDQCKVRYFTVFSLLSYSNTLEIIYDDTCNDLNIFFIHFLEMVKKPTSRPFYR